MQQGGNALPPLVSYQPVVSTRAAKAQQAAAPESKKSDSDLTDKDLLKMLEKLDGLPSDMKVLIDSLQNFYIDQQYSPIPDTSNIASRYISILGQMRTANFNKSQYDIALETVNKNGGINEYAINDRGQIFCANKTKQGDFKLLTVEELKNSSEYAPLTNSELLQYRAYSPKLANNSSIIKVIQNGVGMNTVNDLISAAISKIGSSSQSQEGFFKTKAGNIVSGLNAFMQAVNQASGSQKYNGTVDDLYEYSYLDKNQTKQAKEAMAYIFNTLPENAKSLLKLKSDGTNKGAQQLIETLIASKLDDTQDFKLDIIGGKTAKKLAKDKGSSKDNSDLKTSLPLNVMKGIGGYDQSMRIDKGNGVSIDLIGQYYQQIKSTKGEAITNTSLQNMLAESGLQSIIKNANNITFGDQKLTPAQLANITYNNTGLIRAELPINEDGTVRLEVLDDYEKAQNEIKLLGPHADPEQINEIYHNYGLDDLITADGKPNMKKFGAFMVTEGYSSETNGIKDSDYVKRKELTDQELQLYKDSLTVGTGKDKRVPDVDEDSWWPGDWWGMYDYMYKAAIYIPIQNNVNSAVYGAGQNLDYDEATEQELKYRNFQKLGGMNSTSANLL